MAFVLVPTDALSGDALDGLIDEFVTREGTDYGIKVQTLADKAATVRWQLARGDVVIVCDPESQTSNIIRKDDLPPMSIAGSAPGDHA